MKLKDRNWHCIHLTRSRYKIFRRCSKKLIESGQNTLGYIDRWYQDGRIYYVWTDLSGRESINLGHGIFKTIRAALTNFADEMERRC